MLCRRLSKPSSSGGLGNMSSSIHFRMDKLSRMSVHYRQLAYSFYPDQVSAEITAIADELDNEAARLHREWRLRGRRSASRSSWLDALRRER
jgi:hypothetical protein